jgi:hypothetical protein
MSEQANLRAERERIQKLISAEKLRVRYEEACRTAEGLRKQYEDAVNAIDQADRPADAPRVVVPPHQPEAPVEVQEPEEVPVSIVQDSEQTDAEAAEAPPLPPPPKRDIIDVPVTPAPESASTDLVQVKPEGAADALQISSDFSLFEALEEMGKEDIPHLPATPIMPSFRSIAEMRDAEQLVPQEVEEALEKLSELVPVLGFEGLNPDEVMAISKFVEKKSEMPRDEMVIELADFAGQILMAAGSYMKDQIPKKALQIAQEIQRRERKGEDYKPQEKSLQRIAAATVFACKNLISRNIDPDLLDPTGTLSRMLPDDGILHNPKAKIDPLVVLTLRQIQETVAARRQVDLMKNLRPSYEELISFHTELVLKLQQQGKVISTYFKGDSASAISRNIDFLRSVSCYGANYGRFTPAQVEATLQAFQEYRQTVQFVLNNTPELVEVVKGELVRGEGDVHMAKSELCLRLNDSGRGRKAQQISANCNRAFHAVNFVMEALDTDKIHRGRLKLHRDSYIVNPLATDVLKNYFAMSEEERKEFKRKVFKQADNQINGDNIKVIAGAFFRILDQYITRKELLNS